jgi:asparagine synthase (glutamine-hydrolysing)
MSFCGFVSFSTSDHASQAERAMRAWVSQTAASRDDHEWRDTSSRGWMCAFSLVANAGHTASLGRDPGWAMVGDVPPMWLIDPRFAEHRARLTTSPMQSVSSAIPEIEFALGGWSDDTAQLTLYRCPYGARALFYVCEPRSWIAFASLPEPLLGIPGVTGRIDEASLAAQLIGEETGLLEANATLFARLRRVPPGHALRFGSTGVSIERYWQPDVSLRLHCEPDDPQVPAALFRLLQAGVRRRVAGVKAIGGELSGGLDSSAVMVLAHAQRDADATLHGYTVRHHDEMDQAIFPEEQRLSADLAEQLTGMPQRVFSRNRADRPLPLFHEEYLRRPLSDWIFRAGPHRDLVQAVRDDGCGVLLTGWGGDEMASSRTGLHVLTLLAEGRWHLAALNLLPHDGWPGPLRTLWRDVIAPLRAGLFPAAIWTADEGVRLSAVFASKPLCQWLPRARWRRSSLSLRSQRWNAVHAVGFSQLLELHDWLGQRAGLSMSHPLLDRDLVTFCHAMPSEWVTDRGVRRRGFLAALAGILPPAHYQREKTRHPSFVDHPAWRSQQQELVRRATQKLAESDTWLHDYVNFPALIASRREGATRDRIDWTVDRILTIGRFQRDATS